jgi:hypothetical protein
MVLFKLLCQHNVTKLPLLTACLFVMSKRLLLLQWGKGSFAQNRILGECSETMRDL